MVDLIGAYLTCRAFVPAMIDAVSEQFNQLWEGNHCKTCKRRDVCPVPLEEPAL